MLYDSSSGRYFDGILEQVQQSPCHTQTSHHQWALVVLGLCKIKALCNEKEVIHTHASNITFWTVGQFFGTSEGDALMLYPCEMTDMYLVSVIVASNCTEEHI